MTSNFKDLLIELFVPLARGNGSGCIGTGIPIAKNRILTARHVLFDQNLDTEADFQIRWHHRRDSDEPAGKWQDVSRDRIVFPGNDVLDAAVFEYGFPTEINSWPVLTARNHATGTPWESEGFPDVGKRDDNTREAVPMRGGVYQCAERTRDAWLDVVAPTFPKEWKGASGSPVMVFSCVAGILTGVPAGFRGGRLKALPASRLIEEPSFCDAIDYHPGSDRQAALVKVLECTKRESPIAIGALECCIQGEAGGALWRNPATPVDELAHQLRIVHEII